jgi:tetratricopeptide (TPR) repeat protein
VRKQLETTLSQTIEHGLKAVSIDGADYQNWLTLAQLYQELAGVGIQGAYEQAQQAYTKAREENPTNPLPLFRLGQLETLRGNTSNAIDYFSEAVKVKRDFAPAYFLQSQLLAQQNRLEHTL